MTDTTKKRVDASTLIQDYNARKAKEAQIAAQRVSSAGAAIQAAQGLSSSSSSGGNIPTTPSVGNPTVTMPTALTKEPDTVKFQDRRANDERIAKSNAEIIAKKAAEDKAALALAQRQADKEQRRIREEQQRKANLLKKEALLADEALAGVSKATAPYLNWFANVRTPGGILTLVLILVFFLMAVTPVNSHGDTRLKLLWLTLLGQTSLKYNASNVNNTSSSNTSTTSSSSSKSTSSNGTASVPPNIDLMTFMTQGF